jgi:PBS lyase HEAT-like repeat
LLEVCYFFDIPTPECSIFLRRMMRDADPAVRGQAIRKLHAMWVPIPVEDLPRKFMGEHDGQDVDLNEKDAVAQLMNACEQGETSAAYVLGLLRHKAAIPLLRQLAMSRNIYARYTAARAMIDCGNPEGARPVLEDIIRSQLAIYAGGQDGSEPFYAASSCRALIESGEAERKDGLKRMISLMGYMERSEKPNDEAQLPAVRQHLAAVTGVYFLSEEEANRWFERKYGK